MGRRKDGTSKAGRAHQPRRPHNAMTSHFRSIGELALAVGAEPRRAIIRGEEVTMSQARRLLLLIVENAIAGSAVDLKFLIRTMVEHPDIAGSSREQCPLGTRAVRRRTGQPGCRYRDLQSHTYRITPGRGRARPVRHEG
ncbi:MAG: hypothetical protein WCY11_00180 [Novosphingobium sp.]